MSVLSEFKNHSDPIVSTPSMQEFIEQASVVFGNLLGVMCDLRGVKPKQKREKVYMDDKLHSVFFKIFPTARVANHHTLKYWTMNSNISGFSHGVGRMAGLLIHILDKHYPTPLNAFFGKSLQEAIRKEQQQTTRSEKDNADYSNLAPH